MPKVNADLSNFVSSIINLNVYISELKINHGIDILAEQSGCHLICAVVQDILPGDIMDKYQSITGVEYPSLQQFIDLARKVADRIKLKHRNQDKDHNNSGSLKSTSQNLKFNPNSTIPSNISAVNKQFTKSKPVKKCLLCNE